MNTDTLEEAEKQLKMLEQELESGEITQEDYETRCEEMQELIG